MVRYATQACVAVHAVPLQSWVALLLEPPVPPEPLLVPPLLVPPLPLARPALALPPTAVDNPAPPSERDRVVSPPQPSTSAVHAASSQAL